MHVEIDMQLESFRYTYQFFNVEFAPPVNYPLIIVFLFRLSQFNFFDSFYFPTIIFHTVSFLKYYGYREALLLRIQ